MAELVDARALMKIAKGAVFDGLDLALLFDFDGTLAPICDTPLQTALSPEMKGALVRLAGMDYARVGIISARPRREIMHMLGQVRVHSVAGCNGLDTGGSSTLPQDTLKALTSITSELKSRYENTYDGCFVEDKFFSTALHFRAVKPSRIPEIIDDFYQLWFMNWDNGDLSFAFGKKVIEIMPNSMSKGTAALKMLEKWYGPKWRESTAVFYFGDDTVDEAAFKALNSARARIAATVFVGCDCATAAQYRVENVADVLKFVKVTSGIDRVHAK